MTTATIWVERLREYDALPDDLTKRVLWIDRNPPPVLRLVCEQCGSEHSCQLTWDDVRQELSLHGQVPTALTTQCCTKCERDDEVKP